MTDLTDFKRLVHEPLQRSNDELVKERNRLRAALGEIARMANTMQSDPVSPVTEGIRIRDRALVALGARGDAAIEVLRGR